MHIHRSLLLLCPKYIIALILCLLSAVVVPAQMITGVWQGKAGRQKMELKLILRGDSLVGTSYYYDGPGKYQRYSIRGFYDGSSQEAYWWDDQLLESSGGKNGSAKAARTDFNCPGSGKMMLDGKADERETETLRQDIHLVKTDRALFPDEWDYVIENFTAGANDPSIIDSIGLLAMPRQRPTAPPAPAPKMVSIPAPVVVGNKIPEERRPTVPLSTEEKYSTRTIRKMLDIPLAGDSIEMRFYDNAEIDGDSISLFLNGRLLFTHIRLTGAAYKVKLAVADLNNENELTMVAENLGSIPPNTSYMVAESGGQRYEARLESTEGSSASIRLFKPAQKSPD